MIQRSRDLITGQVTLDYFLRKAAEGWNLTAIEWVREVRDDARAAEPFQVSIDSEELPYGMQLSTDGLRLEPNPLERTVLLLILEKIVREKRITEIATDLNLVGLKTRQGKDWSASAVFELLPRLVEAGPGLLNSSEWRDRRAELAGSM